MPRRVRSPEACEILHEALPRKRLYPCPLPSRRRCRSTTTGRAALAGWSGLVLQYGAQGAAADFPAAGRRTTLTACSASPGKCRAGGDGIRNGVNHGPFGEKNFFIPNLHWPYGLGRANRGAVAAVLPRVCRGGLTPT